MPCVFSAVCMTTKPQRWISENQIQPKVCVWQHHHEVSEKVRVSVIWVKCPFTTKTQQHIVTFKNFPLLAINVGVIWCAHTDTHTHTSLWIEPRGLLLRLSPKHLMRWPLTGETCTHKHTHLHTYALMCTWAHTQQPTKPPAANRLVHTPAKMCAIVQISKHYNWMLDETNCNGSYQKCFLMSYTWMSFVFK